MPSDDGTSRSENERGTDDGPAPPTADRGAIEEGPEQIDAEEAAPIPFAMPDDVDEGDGSEKPRAAVGQLECIDADDEAPVPFAMTDVASYEVKRARAPTGRVEQIDVGGAAPVPLAMTGAASDEAKRARSPTTGRLEQIDVGDAGPIPFSMAAAEKENATSIGGTPRPRHAGLEQMAIEEESDARPTQPYTAAEWDRIPGITSRSNDDAMQEASRIASEDGAAPDEGAIDVETPNAISNRVDADEFGALEVIPEAYLVESDHDVISGYAEPLLPFWKQRRARILFAAIVVFAVAAVIAGVVRPPSEAETNTLIVAATEPPSTSASPSLAPTAVASLPPSVSLAPSSAPTDCGQKALSEAEELPMLHEDPFATRIVMDGSNALAVAHGSTANSAIHVEFFSLTDEGWERSSEFIDEKFEQHFAGGTYSSAISGSYAFVGLYKTDTEAGEEAGIVDVYQRDEFGLWNKLDKPLIPSDGGSPSAWFGRWVDVDGDLACVAAMARRAVFVFRLDEDGTWTQIDQLRLFQPVEYCFVSGDTVAAQTVNVGVTDALEYFEELHIWSYDKDEEAWRVSQDPLPVNWHAVALDGDNLAFSTIRASATRDYVWEGVHIYRRADQGSPYVPHQFFNASDYDYWFGATLAMDKDTLAVFAESTTVIFSERNGYWEESLVLPQAYVGYAVSGRNVLGTIQSSGENVLGTMPSVQEDMTDLFLARIYSLVIDDCTQEMPTQSPSISISPTVSYSSAPCHLIEIEIVFDNLPGNTLWAGKAKACIDDELFDS